MYRAKIYGAGSIGNHLAHAARVLGWRVVVCDINDSALERMKKEIYPGRYGIWDEGIQLCNSSTAPVGGFDLICVGTPPDIHLQLAIQSLHENPTALLIEKPLCKPSLELAEEFYRAAQASATKVFVGYDHAVGGAAVKAEEIIEAGILGQVHTIDVEFREHWAGIFNAHPWLNGPEDSYLGFWERGGGASGEHSHAVNLWQHFAHVVGAGQVVEVQAMLNYVAEGGALYDNLCLMHLRTKNGLCGRVVQDVVTLPSRKRASIQGSKGAIEWVNGYDAEGDAVILRCPGEPEQVYLIPKTRADDFVAELNHIELNSTKPHQATSIGLERGLDTMLVIAAAHRSEMEGCHVRIDYDKGYNLSALQLKGQTRELQWPNT